MHTHTPFFKAVNGRVTVFIVSLSVNLPFSRWEKNVTRQPRANAGSYFIALPVADRQKGVI